MDLIAAYQQLEDRGHAVVAGMYSPEEMAAIAGKLQQQEEVTLNSGGVPNCLRFDGCCMRSQT
ncbi:MAG: hypothetical protein U0176_07790 [Bacteroidia bacterium]